MVRAGSIVEAIQQQIESGVLPVGHYVPSERALADDLGASRSAVRNALAELERLGWIDKQPNCRPRIKGSGRRNVHGSTPRADQIAVWMFPDFQDMGGLMLLQGIRGGLGAAGYDVLVGGSPSGSNDALAKAEHDFIRSLSESTNVAGAIVWNTGNPLFLEAYSRISDQVPFVFVDREPPETVQADVVAANHRRGARTAMRHLLDLGHRRIAMFTTSESASSITDRAEGYRDMLWEAGIEFRPEYLISMSTSKDVDIKAQVHKAMVALFSLPEPPTAIFAVNDGIAFNIQQIAGAMGLEVPRDFSLVGFDWLMRWHPSGGDLTTVSQPFEEIGRAAAECLLRRIRTGLDSYPRQVLLQTSLVVKSSTRKV